MTADDPFARLGLPRRFALDAAAIRDAQRRALARVHPDHAQDALRKADAMRESAAISAAARDLIDPVRRAEILLRSAGVDAAPPPPPELLMTSLEQREALEEAVRGGDPNAISGVLRPIEDRMHEVLSELTRAIDGPRRADDPAGTRGDPKAQSPPAEPLRGETSRTDAAREHPVFDPARAASLLTELRILRRLLEERAGTHASS